MEHTFNIDVDGLKIDNYENYLSRFSNWTQYKREINLNLLLESGKKIEFEVDMDNSQSVNYVSFNDKDFDLTVLQRSCAVIKTLRFVISDKFLISLEITLKILDTQWGKILKNLVESDIIPELNQFKVKNQILNFYFTYDKIAA